MKTFKEFLAEEDEALKRRKLVKLKPKYKNQRTVVYSYPISVGSMYYGYGGGNSSGGEGSGDGGGGGGE